LNENILPDDLPASIQALLDYYEYLSAVADSLIFEAEIFQYNMVLYLMKLQITYVFYGPASSSARGGDYALNVHPHLSNVPALPIL